MKIMKKVLCVIMSVLMIGSTMIFAGAENETKAADTVTGFTDEDYLVVKGRNLVDGLPKDITITAQEVRDALADPLMTIVEAIRTTLEKTPPELSADIIDHGIMLTGGGALLRGIDMLIMQLTGMPVHIAQRPLDCVVDGSGKRLGKALGIQYKHNR